MPVQIFKPFVVSALLSLGAGSAQAYTLACQMTDMRDTGGYIPQTVSLDIDEMARTARIVGPERLLETLDGPDGTLNEVNDSRIEAAIETITYSTSRQRAQMAFRLTWIRKTNRASIAAIPLGYANRFIARGACIRQ